MKHLLKLYNPINDITTFMTANDIDAYSNVILEFNPDLNISSYEHNTMKLEELPEFIRNCVKSTLRVYSECSVTFHNHSFHVITGWYITNSNPVDLFFCGTYKVDDVYTKEEQRENFKEEFGYYSHVI